MFPDFGKFRVLSFRGYDRIEFWGPRAPRARRFMKVMNSNQ